MVVNEALNTIVKNILDRQLGVAIAHLENYLFTFVNQHASEQLSEIKADYERMKDYWLKGFDDPQRSLLYDQLLRRMYVLVQNVYIRHFINNSSFVRSVYTQARAERQDWSVAVLRQELESYVTDVAMLELEPAHTRKLKQKALYESHQRLMASLFDYIWTTRLWSDSVTESFEKMLLSPTVDSADQQLLVSAITVSLLNFFGINKFRLLVDVYRQSSDESVRQRALVGWVLCLNTDAAKLYPEVRQMVKTVTGEDRCLDELVELQMQMVYCLRAESDNRIIQNEIMPELMKNNNFHVTRNGIEEVEDDPMEDVLHPEQSEQRMEKLESTMKRMADMQRQGSDIYFGGFSQMKRFPFFSTVANWFMPFYIEHPAVSDILEHVRGQKFLHSLLKSGPFCDSDKYSFVLSYHTAVSRIPENLLELMDRGEAMLVGAEIDTTEFQTPAFLRRSYLQNLYRFYRVFPQRSEFVNPFDTIQQPRYLFFANSLFQDTRLEEKMGEVIVFLIKHQAYDAARLTLQNYREEQRDAQFYLLNGTVLLRTHTQRNAGLDAATCFARLLELEPDNERGWSGYARALFANGDYKTALEYYHRLSDRHPDSHHYLLNEAVCLTNLEDYESALQLLFKLNYEKPDDVSVSRILAWTLVGACKYEQAERLYQKLLSVEPVASDDLLNYAYCLWFSGSVQQAAGKFREYAGQEGVSFNADHEFLVNESSFISAHGISEVEVLLMIDYLS